jgi:hypothetical protein
VRGIGDPQCHFVKVDETNPFGSLNTTMNHTERRIMKVKLDTMSLIAAAIAVAIWVLVIWTATAAIVAHI